MLACGPGFHPVGHSGFHPIPFAAELPAECRKQNSERTAHIQMPPELWLMAADNRRQMPRPPLLDPTVLAGVVLLAVAALPVFVLVVSIQCRCGEARRLEHQAAPPAEQVADHQCAHRMGGEGLMDLGAAGTQRACGNGRPLRVDETGWLRRRWEAGSGQEHITTRLSARR